MMEIYPNREFMVQEILKDKKIFSGINNEIITIEYLETLNEKELYKIFEKKVHNDSLF